MWCFGPNREIIENTVMFALIGMETGISVSWAPERAQIFLYTYHSTFLPIVFLFRRFFSLVSSSSTVRSR